MKILTAILASLLIIAIIIIIILLVSKTKHNDTVSIDIPQEPPNPDLVEYFSKLFPVKKDWKDMPGNDLERLYLALDCWYNVLPDYKNKIISRQPNWYLDRMDFLWDPQAPVGLWNRLYDGGLCDCVRFSYPNCTYPPYEHRNPPPPDEWKATNRYGGYYYLTDCPDYPGLDIGLTYETLFDRVKAKGFPSYSYYEALSFPGEHGNPEVCGVLPRYLRGDQLGLSYNMTGPDVSSNIIDNSFNILKLPWYEAAWYMSTKCNPDVSCNDTSKKCLYVKNDLQFPLNITGLEDFYCVKPRGTGTTYNERQNYQENYEPITQDMMQLGYVPINDRDIENPLVNMLPTGKLPTRKVLPVTSDFDRNDCSKFPQVPCTEPPTPGFTTSGFWLYPLRGCGQWRTVGRTLVANTKLGMLLTLDKLIPGGPKYKLEDLLAIVGPIRCGDRNLTLQLNRLTEIINKGSVAAVDNWPAKTIHDLQKHGYEGDIISNKNEAKQAAIALMSKWYIEGYTGLGTEEALNGFNYNYTKHFPIGMYFGQAAGLDPLIMGVLVYYRYDSFQMLIEPQNVNSGLKPAYYFEVFQVVANKRADPVAYSWTVYKNKNGSVDTSSTQCGTFYMIDPTLDLENYINYGYVSKEKVDDPEVFDPHMMSFTPAKDDPNRYEK